MFGRKPPTVSCPFTVAVDSREQAAYGIESVYANADRGGARVDVKTERVALPVGDYAILGCTDLVIERKSKSDLFGSVVKRDNFEGRLERMNELAWAAVVVEAELSDVTTNPPRFTRYSPKSLVRTVLAWMQRYPCVHWVFCADRAAGEEMTFRLLERWFLDHANGQSE